MNSKAGRDSVPRYLVFVFLLFAIGISGAGYLYYEAQKTNIKNDRQAGLSAIAGLKVQQIVDWRRERIADAEVIFENSMVARQFQVLLESPSTASESKQAAINWMESLQKYYLYKQIHLLDRKGDIRISLDAEKRHVTRQTLALANEARRARKVIMSDLQRDEKTSEIYIELLVPLFIIGGHDTSSIGLLLFRIDPYQFLYPLIQTWPSTSRTSETLLIRRDGDEVLFLNELRHASNTALSLKLPLSQKQLPAAIALQGKEGIVEGIDYRGVPVLAALRGIPDAPWFLVAKVDLDEVYGPIRERAYLAILLVLILIALTGGIVVALLREQRLRYYRSRYEAELEHNAIVRHYEYLTKYANDIILLADEGGTIVEANDRAVAAYGYTREELIGHDLRTLRSPLVEPTDETRMGEIKEHNGMVYESVHRRKDGSTFPVEISSRMIEVEGKKYFQSIMRDITERKERDKDICTLAQAVRSTSECVLISDLEDDFLFVNDAFTRIYGYDKKELIGKHVRIIRSEKNAPGIVEEILPATLRGGWQGELLNRKKDGTEFPILLSTSVVHDENGNPFALVGVALDITERKRAEEALRDSEWKLKEAQRLGRMGHWEFDVETGQIQWSEMVFELYERDPSLGPPIEEQEAEYYSVEDAARLRSCGQQTIETGKPYQIDVRLKVPGGSVKEVVATGTAVKDSHGRVIRLLGTVQDITERKRVEAQLERNLRETRLRFQVSQALAGAETEDEVLDVLIQNAGLYPQAFVVIFTFDRRGGELTAIGRRQDTFESGLTSVMPNGAGLPASRYTLFSRLSVAQPFVSKDVFTDERIEPAGREILRQTGAASFAMFPLTVGNERMALILAMAKHTGYFDEEKQHLYQTLAEQGALALQAARLRGAIRETQQRYQALVETINDWIWEVDQNGLFTYVSPRISDLLGYEPVELLGKTPFDFMSPEETGRVRGVFDQLSGNRQPVINVENTLLHKDGRLVVFETSAVPFFDPDGKFKGYRGIDRDITEREHAEEALRYERNLLRTLIDNLPDGIYVKDSACRKMIANPADVRNMGRQSEAEVLGKDDFDLFPKDLAERFFADDQSVLQTGRPALDREEYVLDADGQKRWLLTSKLPLRNDKGQIIGLVGIGRDITKRKRAEEALRHEKALMDALMDNIPDSIYFKDRQCRLLRLSRKMMQSLKLDEMSQAIGKTDVDLFGEEFGRKTLADEQRLMASGEPIVALIESRHLGDGQINWTSSTKVPLRDDRGEIVGLVGITREINELMRVQEVLSQERNLLRALIDNLPDQVFVKDRESQFLVCNAGVARRARAGSPTELLEKTDFDIFPQELAAEYFAEEQRIMESGDPIVEQEDAFIEEGGAKTWFSATKIPLRDSQGNIIGLVGVNRDMTERKRAEERLQLSDQILQRVNALVLVGDAKGETTYVSPAVKRILGYDPAEILGDGWWNVCQDDEEGRKREKDFVARCARGEIPLSTMPYERTVKGRDGVPHHILWQDTQGPENTVIGVGHDISERKLLEEQLRQAQKLESLGTLAGGIAHDFNNVLGIILGYTSVLEETKADPKKSSRSIAAINKAVQRGAALVRQLLTFARKTDTLFESVRLNEVILELAGMLEQTFPRTIQVSSHLEKEIPSITGDGNQLHQALLNLSVNARDAMPSGGTLTFTTRALMGAEVRRRFPEAQRKKYVCISVADTGIGMDKPLLARAFEPFFTTKEEGHGTGLGLAVVYGIVASHHGFIDVESQVSRGTTFHLYFPIPERNIQVPLIAAEQPQGQAAGGTETLLVVEDEEMMLDLLKNILAGKGYRVMTAKDGAEAIEVYTQHKDQIDLVLMDMGLPKLSGAEVLKKLQGVNPKVKVILASGYVSPHMKSEVLKAGVKHFVQKPYIPQEILRHIRKVLESDRRV